MRGFKKYGPLAGLVLLVVMMSGNALTQDHDNGKTEKIIWHHVKNTIWWPEHNTEGDHWTAYNTPDNNKDNPQQVTDLHLTDPVLEGAIDLHAHHGPDSYPRYADAFEIAKLMQERGMRGAVFKNHWQETASIAYLIDKYATPDTGFLAFGATCMDTPEGGVNPNAVRYMADVQGGFGKVVWMPTHDSEHEVKEQNSARPYVAVSKAGKLLPEVLQVLDLIKERDLTLATGHVTPEEMLLLTAAAKQRGITKIIVTHPNLGPQFTDPTLEQLMQAVADGAYIEVVSGQTRRADIIQNMFAIGPEHIVVSSDSGLARTTGNNHTDALVMAAERLRAAGFTEQQLDLMYKDNPAKVLGLPVL